MKAVVQRVSYARVMCEGEITGEIEKGILVFIGVTTEDTKEEADLMARKLVNLRIFRDENGVMNLSLRDIDGEVLSVSNFTLCADTSHGRRPNYMHAAKGEQAKPIYNHFLKCLVREKVKKVQNGVFGGDMKVELLNQGPVTVILDTDDWKHDGEKNL